MWCYCVKERKGTKCVPGSEEYVVTSNGKYMVKCICSSWGYKKAKFISQTAYDTESHGIHVKLMQNRGLGEWAVISGCGWLLKFDCF